jgi:hypothetical protein
MNIRNKQINLNINNNAINFAIPRTITLRGIFFLLDDFFFVFLLDDSFDLSFDVSFDDSFDDSLDDSFDVLLGTLCSSSIKITNIFYEYIWRG